MLSRRCSVPISALRALSSCRYSRVFKVTCGEVFMG
jgi:hypothetical protein